MKKYYNYIVVFCLLTFLISTVFMTSCVKKEKVTKNKSENIEEGTSQTQDRPKAPDFQAKNLLDDGNISMADMKGYVLIIDFWATWCPPCRLEIPSFIELYDKYKDKKFAVIGISVDRGGETVVKKFMREQKVNYPMIMATREIQRDYEKAMGQSISAIPTTLVVNKEGGIESVHIGFKAKDVFEKEIQKLLGES